MFSKSRGNVILSNFEKVYRFFLYIYKNLQAMDWTYPFKGPAPRCFVKMLKILIQWDDKIMLAQRSKIPLEHVKILCG